MPNGSFWWSLTVTFKCGSGISPSKWALYRAAPPCSRLPISRHGYMRSDDAARRRPSDRPQSKLQAHFRARIRAFHLFCMVGFVDTWRGLGMVDVVEYCVPPMVAHI